MHQSPQEGQLIIQMDTQCQQRTHWLHSSCKSQQWVQLSPLGVTASSFRGAFSLRLRNAINHRQCLEILATFPSHFCDIRKRVNLDSISFVNSMNFHKGLIFHLLFPPSVGHLNWIIYLQSRLYLPFIAYKRNIQHFQFLNLGPLSSKVVFMSEDTRWLTWCGMTALRRTHAVEAWRLSCFSQNVNSRL